MDRNVVSLAWRKWWVLVGVSVVQGILLITERGVSWQAWPQSLSKHSML